MPTLTNLKVPNRVRRKRKHAFFQSLFFMVIIILALFFLLQSPLFNIKSLSVKGNELLSSEDVIKLAGINPGINIFKANLSNAEQKVKMNPLVKKVSISRELPNGVEILIVERKPVGLIPDKNGFIEVDKDGVYLAVVDYLDKNDFPIITGDKPLKGGPGDKVATEKIMAAISYIVAIPSDVKNTVEEIHVQDLNQITIYTQDRFQVRLGGTDKIEEKAVLYKALIKQTGGEKIDYIDIADIDHPAKKLITPKAPADKNQQTTTPYKPPAGNPTQGLGSIPD